MGANLQLPGSLKLKSLAVRSGVGTLAIRFRRLLGLRQRLKHPELRELHLEESRLDLVLEALLKPDSCAADVGAHIGSFLDAVLKLAPQGKHYAVEASPTKANWLRSRFPEVEIFSVAVSNAAGTATFYEDVRHPGFSSLISNSASGDSINAYQVETRTLDDLLAGAPRLDLLKLDIEGAELDALRGATGLIARCSPALIFECGTEYQRSRQDLFEFITGTLGYEIHSFTDFLYEKGPLSFDEFRKFGVYPFHDFNSSHSRAPGAPGIAGPLEGPRSQANVIPPDAGHREASYRPPSADQSPANDASASSAAQPSRLRQRAAARNAPIN